jgi:hypothetical protein
MSEHKMTRDSDNSLLIRDPVTGKHLVERNLVDTQQLRFVGLGIIPIAGSKLLADAADELEALRKAADGVLKAYMPQFTDSRAVDDCLVELALARTPS